MTYNFCQKCCTRFEACADCHAAELAAKDKEIARLIALIESAKCCETCLYDTGWHGHNPCEECFSKKTLPRWELAK